MRDSDVRALIDELARRAELAHHVVLPAKPAVFQEPRAPLSAELTSALASMGIAQLYSHQATCLDAVRAGRDAVVCAGTAGGKTMAFLLPILERIAANPQSRALFIYPTNALVNDQVSAISTLLAGLAGNVRCAVYTGQTGQAERYELKAQQPNILLTNPEMLHYGMLPWHPTWARTLANLEFVVVDEVHKYTGVFGAHMSHLMARLRHICRQYNSAPRFIFASATIANPAEHAAHLAGRQVELVDNDGAGSRARHFVLWNPLAASELGETQLADAIRCSNEAAVELLVRMIKGRLPTIAFVRSRKQTEELARRVLEGIGEPVRPGRHAVVAYHGDMTSTVRRAIETDLREGRISCVVTTNALELGVDIGDLDACLIKGFPGSFVSVWQQAGRAGRRTDDSVVIYVADADPVDQYYMRHPDEFFGKPLERAVIDRGSPRILEQHLLSLILENEILVTRDDIIREFGEPGLAVMGWLTENEYVSEVEPWRRCSRCGREMVARNGRRGRFLGCTGYRSGRCDNTATMDPGGTAAAAVMLVCPDEDCGATYDGRTGAKFCHRCGKPLQTKSMAVQSWRISDKVDEKLLRSMPLRSMDAEDFKLVDTSGHEIGIEIGSRDVHREAHPGAVYTMGGISYRVMRQDTRNREVVVEREGGTSTTIPRCTREVVVRDHDQGRDFGGCAISFGGVAIQEHVNGFLEINANTGRRCGGADFASPFTWKLETRGLIVCLARPRPATGANQRVLDAAAFRAGLAGVASAMVSVIAPLVMCERRDIDGLVLPDSPGRPDSGSVCLFDRFEGGIGLAAKAYESIELVLRRARDLVTDCECRNPGGCVKCLLAPGSRVRAGDIDKGACVAILGAIRW